MPKIYPCVDALVFYHPVEEIAGTSRRNGRAEEKPVRGFILKDDEITHILMPVSHFRQMAEQDEPAHYKAHARQCYPISLPDGEIVRAVSVGMLTKSGPDATLPVQGVIAQNRRGADEWAPAFVIRPCAVPGIDADLIDMLTEHRFEEASWLSRMPGVRKWADFAREAAKPSWRR